MHKKSNINIIKETPVLYGKEAENFLKNIKKNEFQSIKSSDLEKIKSNFDRLNKIAKFK